ncbi:MAG: TonB-dependent receptor [Ignavibacteriales bacterium]|nr:MAG: TonB-dependent receptor [Ignavibacteriales bacterium]
MKKLVLLFSFLSTILFQINLFSQSSSKIFGQVIDEGNGEAIIGANVFIEGTNLGSATDIQGQFSIRNVPAGTYNLIVSYISYTKKTIKGIVVENGKDLELNITLQSEAIETDEIVVVGELSLQYESALLNQRKKSTTISDGISAEQIKKSTDNTTAETLRRVPGITLMDNKYIFVRGVSERYSSALLNNAPLASSEPDKRDFAFDLIPANLIENTIVEKSFTPDNPGDFAGGVVKVNTIDFPSKTIFTFGYSTSYVNDVSTKNFKTYEGSSTDFLGLDDGKRDLPQGFPDPLTYYNYGFNLLDTNRTYWSTKLSDDWKVSDTKAFLDQSFGLTYGDRFTVFENDFGIVSSLTYKTGFSSKDVVTKDIASRDDGTFFFDYSGVSQKRNVYWGGILNLTYKVGDNHKVGLKNTLTINSDDEVTRLRGFKYDYQDERITTALKFVSRSLYSGQLTGTSHFDVIDGLQLDWNGSYSVSYRDEPDYRRVAYTRNIADSNTTVPFIAYIPQFPEYYGGGRFYSYLQEHKRGIDLSFEQRIELAKVKFGANHITTNRSFNARLLSVTDANQQGNAQRLIGNYELDSLYSVKNFENRIVIMKEYYNPSNDYTASDNLISFFLMTELPFNIFNLDFVLVGGARLENYVLKVKTFSSVSTALRPIHIDNFNSDVLPAFSLIYRMNDETNIRFSFSRTINRAQFREIAPFQYYNFEDQTFVRGNDTLKQANISNYDLRFEMFPQPGHLISASLFLKEIRNPIERVFEISTGQNDRTFANSPFARNAGVELEYRTSFGVFWDALTDFMLTANYSRIWSEIEETNIGLDRTIRPMQGQSPYVINLSLGYQNVPWDLSVNVSYNRFGKRIVETANFQGSDIYELPRDVVDFVITKGFGEHLEFKVTMKDFLNDPIEYYEEDILVRRYTTNTKLSLGVSYRL